MNPRQPFERDPVLRGEHRGVLWCIYLAPRRGALNGYARIPGEFTVDDEDPRVDVHGGITFNERGWIGFDAAHAGDYWDADELETLTGQPLSAMATEFSDFERELAKRFPAHWSRAWSVEKMVEETIGLADQLADMHEQARSGIATFVEEWLRK